MTDYEVQEWPPIRNIVELFLNRHRPHTVYGLGEYDITLLSEKLKGSPISLNTFLVYALARASIKNEKMRTYKHRNKMIVFKHADVGVPMLKKLPNGVRVPVAYIVRKADTKSLKEIHLELREAIKQDLTDDPSVKLRRKLATMPGFVQKLVYAWIFSHPVRMKKFIGNMGITNLRQSNYSSPFMGLPLNVYSCQFSIGNTSERFLPDENKQPQLRKLLSMAAGMDHLVMDGMCMAAIAKDLGEIVEKAEGLA
jgi:hypothetical protein